MTSYRKQKYQVDADKFNKLLDDYKTTLLECKKQQKQLDKLKLELIAVTQKLLLEKDKNKTLLKQIKR